MSNESMFDGAVELQVHNEPEVVVVNPNPGRPLTLQLGDREVTFHPMQKYRIKKDQLGGLCEVQEGHWREMRLNAQSERQEWAKRITSPSQAERDKALKFADSEGNTVTKPPPRPMLVRLDTEHGKKWYQEALAEADRVPVQHPIHPQQQPRVEADELESDVDAIVLEEPKKGWTILQYFDYCKRLGAQVDESDKERSDILIKKAKAAFEAQKLFYKEKKINFTIK